MGGCDLERERSHEGWVCPPEIVYLGELPLYQAVACWSLLLERAVTVADVSQGFHVSERRASDVLHYITHDALDVIESESRVVRCLQGRRKTVRVLSVQSPLFCRTQKAGVPQWSVSPGSRGRTAGNGRKCRENNRSEVIQALRTWFVSRRQGERVPEVVPGESPDVVAARMFPDSGE
ncbi:CaiF/GrlA family transcriptional regulator [Salmonella enterica]|nr:CaiF/GrlA family transcriptional regulator [Salmonella enterica]ELF5202335.1 CaiF/GrlA family transcriptional regulator [Salmonella enterica]